jgi:N-methylhydantoinase B
LRSPSGGGYGPAAERPAENVLRDVCQGFVSRERAHCDYGVVIREDATVDEEATEALRKEMGNAVGRS